MRGGAGRAGGCQPENGGGRIRLKKGGCSQSLPPSPYPRPRTHLPVAVGVDSAPVLAFTQLAPLDKVAAAHVLHRKNLQGVRRGGGSGIVTTCLTPSGILTTVCPQGGAAPSPGENIPRAQAYSSHHTLSHTVTPVLSRHQNHTFPSDPRVHPYLFHTPHSHPHLEHSLLCYSTQQHLPACGVVAPVQQYSPYRLWVRQRAHEVQPQLGADEFAAVLTEIL